MHAGAKTFFFADHSLYDGSSCTRGAKTEVHVPGQDRTPSSKIMGTDTPKGRSPERPSSTSGSLRSHLRAVRYTEQDQAPVAFMTKSMMNRIEATAMIGWISFALRVASFTTQYMMKPAAIPLVIP